MLTIFEELALKEVDKLAAKENMKHLVPANIDRQSLYSRENDLNGGGGLLDIINE
jgi:hypothetical protein